MTHHYTPRLKSFLRCVLLTVFSLSTMTSFAQEICGNGLDDDGDGFIDCFDPDCGGATAIVRPVAIVADDAEEIEDSGLMELTDLELDLDFRPNKMVGIFKLVKRIP
ncbi:MAG: hypothetical protein AAFQ87_10365, partial [Bacteroidota bacterium]